MSAAVRFLLWIQELVRDSRGTRAISGGATEVILFFIFCFTDEL